MATGWLEAMVGECASKRKRTSDEATDGRSEEGFEALSACPKGNGRLYCGAQRTFDEIDMTRGQIKSRRCKKSRSAGA
jgi:hypothetical protein